MINDRRETFAWPTVPGPWKRISKSFWLAFLSACLIGTITHLYMFTNLLLNHDSATQLYTSNDVLSSGRWALEYLSVFSTCFQLPVVTGLISLLAIAVSAGLTVQVLELTHPVHIVLASALLVTFPSAAAIFSYLFTADAYFLCLMLNALAVYCTRNYRWGWLFGLPLLTAACGTYQAFICYAIGLFLFDCILRLLKNESLDRVLHRGAGYILLCAAALILYYVVLNLLLYVTGTQLVDYQGLSGMSLENFGRFFAKIPSAYQFFEKNILTPGYLTPFFQRSQAAYTLFAGILALYLVVKQNLFRDPPRLLLLAAGTALIPLALNFVSILALGAEVHELMIYSFVLFFLMIIKYAELVMAEQVHEKNTRWSAVFFLNLILCLVVIWGNFCTTNTAYLRLQIRYENTFAAANRVMARIEALDGYTWETPVALVGYLPHNAYGKTVDAFSQTEAPIGTEDDLLLSYYSLPYFMETYIGLHLPKMTADQWQAVYCSDILDEMPCYPSEGSVILYEGVAVVKFSDPY